MFRSMILAVSLGFCAVHAAQAALVFDDGNGYNTTNGVGVVTTALTGVQDLTVEAWVKPSRNYNSTINPVFAVFAGSQQSDFVFGIYKGHLATFHRSAGGYQETDKTVPNAQWSHIAFSRSGQTLTFYLNGEKVKTLESEKALPACGAFPPIIGGQRGDTSTVWGNVSFGGRLADVRVWTGVRTGEEIAANYQKRLAGNESGLLVYVPVYDAVGSVAVDRVSGRPTLAYGTWSIVEDAAFPTLTDAAPAPVPQDALRVPYRANTETSGKNYVIDTDVRLSGTAFTIEAWVYTTKLTTKENPLVSQRDFGTLHAGVMTLGIRKNSLKPYVYFHNGSAWGIHEATAEITAQTWSHIAYVRDGSTIRFYINGESAGEVTGAYAGEIWSSNLKLLNSSTGTPQQECFYGGIRELRAWNTARTAEEIKANYRRRVGGTETGLVGAWPFTEGVGSTVYNVVNGKPSTLTDGMTAWSGNIYQSYALTTAPLLAPPARGTESVPVFGGGWYGLGRTGLKPQLGDFTMEAWIKPRSRFATSDDTYQASWILSQNATDEAPGRWFFCLYNHRELTFFMRSNGAGEGNLPGEGWVRTGVMIPADRWSHVAVTRHGAVLVFFVNGRPVYTRENFVACPTPSTDEILIAKGLPNTAFGKNWSQSFDGSLREVRVWNFAMSAKEIARSYDKELTGRPSSLVAVWALKDASAPDGVLYAGWTQDVPVPFAGTIESVRKGMILILR